ncbi:MAG: SagB/ThcOx family dehydrogenase [Chloroflexi bacterium]|nr:SagB/ThcOx family dehydrogenase [Chloroflexota bacterium]
MSVEEAIARRRSVRRFRSEPLSLAELSQILWAAQGITDMHYGRRTAPSPGATYSLELFIACGKNTVEGLNEGVYHYSADGHSLSLHQPDDVRPQLVVAGADQEFLGKAAIDIIICTALERVTVRYGDRSERYVNMEIGHVGQNIYLQAVSLGLATVGVAAFRGKQVSELLKLGPELRAMYIMPVGRPASHLSGDEPPLGS